MSSEVPESGELETLDFLDVIRFFQGVPLKEECPCCSKISWEIPVVKGRDSDVVLNPSGMMVNGKNILELRISCNICGYFRAHKVEVIKNWLQKNPLVSGPADD